MIPSVDQMWALSVRDGTLCDGDISWVRARFRLRLLAHGYDGDVSPPDGLVTSAAGILAGDDVTLGSIR